MTSSESITESIINAKKSIKKKLFELKRGVDKSNTFMRTHLSSIVTPLEELAERHDEGGKKQLGLSKFNDSVLSTKALEFDNDDDDVNTPKNREYDNVYGLRLNEDGEYFMGDKKVVIDEENETIKVGELKKCRFTKGLQEILFKSHPRVGYFDNNDLTMYKCFLIHTRCHRKANGKLKANSGFKYKYIIGPLFKPNGQDVSEIYECIRRKSGEGIPDPYISLNVKKSKEYVYWDDPNELVQRLAILHATKQAGNTGVDNEIISIEEELREIGVIL